MISYQNNINETINNIYLCGIKFKIDGIKEAKLELIKEINRIEENAKWNKTHQNLAVNGLRRH